MADVLFYIRINDFSAFQHGEPVTASVMRDKTYHLEMRAALDEVILDPRIPYDEGYCEVRLVSDARDDT